MTGTVDQQPPAADGEQEDKARKAEQRTSTVTAISRQLKAVPNSD